MSDIVVTPRGHVLVEKELKLLKEERRPAIIKAIAEAREHGDLKENSEYHAAREEQAIIEGRIQELEYIYSSAQVLRLDDFPESYHDTVILGCAVELQDVDNNTVEKYRLVGKDEAQYGDKREDANGAKRINFESPVGQAIIGEQVGTTITVQIPNSPDRHLKIVAVEFNNEPVDAE